MHRLLNYSNSHNVLGNPGVCYKKLVDYSLWGQTLTYLFMIMKSWHVVKEGDDGVCRMVQMFEELIGTLFILQLGRPLTNLKLFL